MMFQNIQKDQIGEAFQQCVVKQHRFRIKQANRYGGSHQKDSKIILPGQSGNQRTSNNRRIALPNDNKSAPKQQNNENNYEQQLNLQKLQEEGEKSVLAKGDNKYRPPKGFMNIQPQQLVKIESPQVALDSLTTQSGHWHQLGNLLAPLMKEGFSGLVIEQLAGVDRHKQNLWNTAATVYESIQDTNEVAPEILQYFNPIDFGDKVMYDMRTLDTKQRVRCAQYIAQYSLDAQEALILIKSIEEHYRDNGTREGFTLQPGDCLAYKYYKLAVSTTKFMEIKQYLSQARVCATTDGARAVIEKLSKVMQEREEAKLENKTLISVFRLKFEEANHRAVPVIGTFGEVTIKHIEDMPLVYQQGSLPIYSSIYKDSDDSTLQQQYKNISWAVLPGWIKLVSARQPFGIIIKNCSEVKAFEDSIGARSQKEIQENEQPALLVVDRKVKEFYPNFFYLQKTIDNGVEIIDGQDLKTRDRILGKVLFIVRQPKKEYGQPSELDLMEN